MPVIMGRKTFESLGKPLGGRTNIVVTRNEHWDHPGVLLAGTLEQAIQLAEPLQTEEVFIIGGGTIYREALPMTDRVYLTRVHTKIQDADTWFPILDPDQWEMKWEQPFKADDKHIFDYSFQCWERKARS